MNESKVMTIFNYQNHEVRTVEINGKVHMVMKDLADILVLQSTDGLRRRLDPEDTTLCAIESGGQMRQMHVVTETGAYDLILMSRSPDAIKIKRWLTHEVMPEIQATGGYNLALAKEQLLNDMILDPAMGIRMLQAIEMRDKIIAEQQPSVDFANAVGLSSNNILIGDFAKILCQNGFDIGQNRLFKDLRRDGYLLKQKGLMWNRPSQWAVDEGWLTMKQRTVNHSDGHVTTEFTPRMTGKGQLYFMKKYLARRDAQLAGGGQK